MGHVDVDCGHRHVQHSINEEETNGEFHRVVFFQFPWFRGWIEREGQDEPLQRVASRHVPV